MHARAVTAGSLPASGLRIGRESEAWLAVKGGLSGRVRLPQGEPLEIALKIQDSTPLARARIYTDLGSTGEFYERDLSRNAEGVFQILLPTERTGNFHFTLQYTLDGISWFWLRGDLWQLLVFPRVLRDLRLYTLIPNASGPMEQWDRVLRKAAALGFNMVHILPLTKQGHSQSPYAAADLFALEPRYMQGQGFAAFERLVATAQELKIGFCLDLVLNHVAIDSELVERCPHWIRPDAREKDGLKRNGFVGPDGFHKWDDLALLYYQHPDRETRRKLWSYMESYALFWASYAAATGGMIRLDNLHSTDPAFARHITRRLRLEHPDLGILGEFFASQESTQRTLQHYALDLLLATTWEHHFAEELRRYFRYMHETVPLIPWFTPVNSHDSGTPAEEFADVRATKPRYILCALLGIGTTGLTQGVEHGQPEKINFIGQQTEEPTASSGINYEPIIQRTHELLVECSAFTQQGNVEFIDHGHVAIIGALRRTNKIGDAQALVIANLDIHQQQTLSIDLQSIGLGQSSLTDAFSQRRLEHDGRVLHCILEPCGFVVYLAR